MGKALKDKAVDGAFWKVLSKGVNQLVGFCVGIAMARMLSPTDYGTVGLLAIFFALASVFQDSGMGLALVQKSDCTSTDFSTVFYFNVAVSVLVYIVLFLSAPLIAAFYNVPQLCEITRVSAISFIISGLTAVQYAKLGRDLNFRMSSILSIIGMLTSAVAGVVLAYLGYGVWALVIQGLISALLTGAILWSFSSWTPSLEFSCASFRALFGVGGKLLLSNIINTLYNNLYTLVIGKFFSPAAVGHFNRANGYAQVPMNLVNDLSLGVSFPVLVKLQGDHERLLNAYRKLMCVPMYLLYPCLIGLMVCADPLIVVMIGEKWRPCVPLLQVLCFGYMFMPLSYANLSLLFVKGRTDLTLKMEFVKKPVAFLLLFASIPFGIFWMIVGRALYSVLVFFYNSYYTKKILNYGWYEQLKSLFSIYCNVAIMGCVTFCVMLLPESPVSKLVVGIPCGVFSYWVGSLLLHDSSYYEIVDIIKKKIKSNGKT